MSEVVFVEQAPEQGKQHSLAPGTTIGREGCDVTIPDPEMSRRQAQVLRDGDAVVIEDLGSTNGTFVNGQRITGRHTLENGDEVRFGATVWKLQAPAGGATRLADSPVADPQVTRARAIPEPATAQTAARPTPAAAAPAAAGPSRGDVPAPDFQPSVIRRVVPPPGAPAAFTPDTSPRGRGRGGRSGSAATRVSATVFTTLVTALTAAGVVIYYITEPFK